MKNYLAEPLLDSGSSTEPGLNVHNDEGCAPQSLAQPRKHRRPEANIRHAAQVAASGGTPAGFPCRCHQHQSMVAQPATKKKLIRSHHART